MVQTAKRENSRVCTSDLRNVHIADKLSLILEGEVVLHSYMLDCNCSVKRLLKKAASKRFAKKEQNSVHFILHALDVARRLGLKIS